MSFFTPDFRPTRLRRNLLTVSAITAVSALALTGCGLTGSSADASDADDEDKTISIIVTETAPFQQPTEIAKELLAEEGWTLEPTYVTDIVQPNEVVSQGEYDANFFQHAAYLRQFNADNDTDVVPAFGVYYTPSGIFSLNYDTYDDLPDGATIALPVDRSNNGRALNILSQAGVIEITDGIPITQLSQEDITDNPKNLNFVEIDQQSTARSLPDIDAGFSFTSLISEAGYDPEELQLGIEEIDDPFTFTVFLSVREGEQDSAKTQALQEAYQSAEVEQWYSEWLGGVSNFSDEYNIDNVDERWQEFLAE